MVRSYGYNPWGQGRVLDLPPGPGTDKDTGEERNRIWLRSTNSREGGLKYTMAIFYLTTMMEPLSVTLPQA